jgi:hypothetical protein
MSNDTDDPLPPVDPDDIVLRARHGDPATAHAACAAYDREKLASAGDLVVQLHQTHGPLADYELRDLFAEHYGMYCDDSLYRQARNAARNQGLIRDTGTRRLNPLTKRQQVVWEACRGEPVVVRRCPACGHVLGREKAQHDGAAGTS